MTPCELLPLTKEVKQASEALSKIHKENANNYLEDPMVSSGLFRWLKAALKHKSISLSSCNVSQ